MDGAYPFVECYLFSNIFGFLSDYICLIDNTSSAASNNYYDDTCDALRN